MFKPTTYFDLSSAFVTALFDGEPDVWESISRIKSVVYDFVETEKHDRPIRGHVSPGAWIDGDVIIEKGATIEPGAYIKGPAIISEGATIAHGAYLRGGCFIGKRCMVGHATEIKNAVLLDGASAAHFNYVGDSILGSRVNLGAGVKVSNFKNDGTVISVTADGQRFSTGLRKFGAIIGDGVMIGCNAVTSPGTLIGKNTSVYANAVVSGVIPAGRIVKLRQQVEIVEKV